MLGMRGGAAGGLDEIDFPMHRNSLGRRAKQSYLAGSILELNLGVVAEDLSAGFNIVDFVPRDKKVVQERAKGDKFTYFNAFCPNNYTVRTAADS